MQSYRLTGQLFFKVLHTALHERMDGAMACLPVLKVLKRHGELSQGAIARELHHSDAAISRQVGILLDNGLIRTRIDPDSRRTTLVAMTDAGEAYLKQVEGTVTAFLSEVLTEMSDEEVRQLIDGNNRLQTIMTAQLGKESHV